MSRPAGPLPTWARRLALLVTALGLVAMHHVVAAHQHAPADPVPVSTAASVPAPVPGHDVAAADLHRHPEGTGDDGGHQDQGGHRGHDHATLLHLCLAVLVAGAVLLLGMLSLAVRRVPSQRSGGPGAVVAVVPHPPPISSRLAALQVLRL